MTRGAWLRALHAHDDAARAMRAYHERPSRRALLRAEDAIDFLRRAVAGWTDRQLAALHRKTAKGWD